VTEHMYSEEVIERLFKLYYKNTRFSSLIKPCIINSYDLAHRLPVIFNRDEARQSDDQDYYLHDVVRATTAAPIYFKPAKIKSIAGGEEKILIDGAVYANNPSLCAIVEAMKTMSSDNHNLTAKDMTVLSLGSGIKTKGYEYDDAKDWGALGWIKPVLDIFMSGASETIHYQARQLFISERAEAQYLRLNTTILHANPDLDAANADNIALLKNEAHRCIEENREAINAFVKTLL
jgi:uncharacterized protein